MRDTVSGSPSGSELSSFAQATDRPVFVGACPRSGTTLLRTMLNSHPDLAVPRESRFLVEAWRRRSEFGDLRKESHRRRLAQWIFHNKATRPGRIGVPADTAIERLAAAPPTFGSLIGTCFLMYAERHGKRRWGDKRPHYAQELPAIFAMFPDAQFINVVRDPRGSVASIRKLGWFDGDVALAAELWCRATRRVDAWRGRLAPDQLLEIRYEDLVGDPRSTLERICAFLSMDTAGVESMLAYHEDTDVPENRYHWRVSQPVSPDAVRSWEQTLTPAEVAFVETVSGSAMRRYGYEPAAAGVAVPLELRRRFTRRRVGTDLSRARQASRDVRTLVTCPYPVAARLTTGQQDSTLAGSRESWPA